MNPPSRVSRCSIGFATAVAIHTSPLEVFSPPRKALGFEETPAIRRTLSQNDSVFLTDCGSSGTLRRQRTRVVLMRLPPAASVPFIPEQSPVDLGDARDVEFLQVAIGNGYECARLAHHQECRFLLAFRHQPRIL